MKVVPTKVKATDQVVFWPRLYMNWPRLYMNHKDRAATYPADFDTHDEDREARYPTVPVDPHRINEAHGLYWFAWKVSYTLAKSWWPALDWMMDKAIPRTIAALPRGALHLS